MMKRWSSAVFPLAVMLVLTGLTFWLMHAVQLPDTPRDGKHRHDPDTIISDLTLQRLDASGRLQYELRAPEMLHYPDDESTHVRQPRFFALHPARPTVTMSAVQAQVSANGKQIHLQEQVRVERAATRDRPLLLATMPDLVIATEAETAHTASPVVITQGRSRLAGTGMHIDNKTQTFTLEAQVRGQFASKYARSAP